MALTKKEAQEIKNEIKARAKDHVAAVREEAEDLVKMIDIFVHSVEPRRRK